MFLYSLIDVKLHQHYFRTAGSFEIRHNRAKLTFFIQTFIRKRKQFLIFVSPIRINNTKNNDNEQIENVYNSHSRRNPILPFGS